MGSSPSSTKTQCPEPTKTQCPVQPVHQAQIPIGCKCGNSKVKWRCENCVSMLCDMCKDKDHAAKRHHIFHITTKVKISDVKEYQIKVDFISLLAVAHDNSLWIGDGTNSHTALQNVQLVEDKVKILSSFEMKVLAIAVTPTNDILLATGEPRLKKIKAGSNKVTDSVYYANQYFDNSVHVTNDGRVIVGGYKVVVVMDSIGTHLTRYDQDKNKKQIFSDISSITSTTNGNIFVASEKDNKLVVFGKKDIIRIYRGHPTVNDEVTKFYPSSVVTTPMDNVIVADCDNDTLHILNNTGDLLTIYNTMNIGLLFPGHLAITIEGSFTVLYMTSMEHKSLYKMVITGC